MLTERKGVLLDGIGQELVRSANGGRRKTLSQWLAQISDEVATTFTSGDASPSVLNGTQFITAGSTAITDFDDAVEGQVIYVYRGDADIVITRDGTHIETLNTTSITLTATHPMAAFRSVSGVWQEVERSDGVIKATSGNTKTLADWMALINALGATAISSAMAAVVQAATTALGRAALGISSAMDAVITAASTAAGARAMSVPYRLANVAALQAATWTSATAPLVVTLDYNYVAGDGGGLFRYDSSDTSSSDNSGTIILTSTSGTALRYKRIVAVDGNVEAQWFGDLSSGFSATVAKAITAAGIGGLIAVPRGNYSMSAGLTLLAQQTLMFQTTAFNEDFATAHVTSVTRAFNGTAFDMSASGCRIEGLNFDGVGATYTGVCVSISGGEQQWMQDCDIDDNADACLSFTAADAGQRFVAHSCGFRRTTASNPAVLLPTSTDTAGNRQFLNCNSYGGVLLRFNSGINTHILDGRFTNLDFSGSDGVSLRAIVSGCRIAALGSDFAVYGNDTTIIGNVIAGAGTVNGAASRNRISGNCILSGATWTDSSTATGDNVNEIWDAYYSPTISWKADSADPALGNGTLSCRVYRSGRKLKVDVSLVMGSTTTFGTGAWYFQLPSPFSTWVAKASAVGKARLLDSGTAYDEASAVIAGGSARIYLFPEGNGMSDTNPFTWTTNDTLTFTVEYEIS